MVRDAPWNAAETKSFGGSGRRAARSPRNQPAATPASTSGATASDDGAPREGAKAPQALALSAERTFHDVLQQELASLAAPEHGALKDFLQVLPQFRRAACSVVLVVLVAEFCNLAGDHVALPA
jgi:hypothetical protein